MISAVGLKKNIILVTGGHGLVGSAIEEVIHNDCNYQSEDEEWHFISSKDGDLRSAADTEKIFQKYKPTLVVHLAASVGGLFKNLANQASMFGDNILINHNVIDACHNHGVKKLVSCLSTCIFPDKTTYPIDDTMIHQGKPHQSNFGYAYAKRMLDVESR